MSKNFFRISWIVQLAAWVAPLLFLVIFRPAESKFISFLVIGTWAIAGLVYLPIYTFSILHLWDSNRRIRSKALFTVLGAYLGILLIPIYIEQCVLPEIEKVQKFKVYVIDIVLGFMVVAILVFLSQFLIIYTVPVCAQIYYEMGRELPWHTQLALSTSQLLKESWFFNLGTFYTLVCVLATVWGRIVIRLSVWILLLVLICMNLSFLIIGINLA